MHREDVVREYYCGSRQPVGDWLQEPSAGKYTCRPAFFPGDNHWRGCGGRAKDHGKPAGRAAPEKPDKFCADKG